MTETAREARLRRLAKHHDFLLQAMRDRWAIPYAYAIVDPHFNIIVAQLPGLDEVEEWLNS